ncbi:MAG TPA: pilus assembly protein TadG-related protein [Caulobacteraceae bacterium]|nr:pilus assembly protein TadG-related protein [Caulobacteraceae bacterium]
MRRRRGILSRALAFIRTALRHDAGATAVTFAVLAPILAVIGAGAIELGQLNSDRSATQDAADAAALMGAKQLSVSPNGVEQRTDAYAEGELNQISGHAAVSVSTSVGVASVTVVITTHRASFFGNLIPLGGFTTQVRATAMSEAAVPLCVLAIAPSGSDLLQLQNTSQINAPGCAVDSNQSVAVAAGAALAAEATEAGTTASGPISPAALTGAANIPDPFASLNIAAPSSCPANSPQVTIGADTVLPAGVHCGDYQVTGSYTLTLAPGEHYFEGNLTGKGGSMITGTDVVVIFGPTTVLNLKGASNISLNGRQSGPLAGFVIAVDRGATGTFQIQTDPFTNITGAIYAPTVNLNFDGAHQAAQASQWTVVTARSITLTNSPDIVINSNYAGSTVPVPTGVGTNIQGNVVLKK